jgi:hypothetical protein
MAELIDPKVPETADDNPDYTKPNPQANPRNISMAEIANRVAAQHKEEFAESAPVIDDDHNPVAAPDAAPEEPAQEPAAEETAAEPVAVEPAAAPTVAAAPAQEAIDPGKEYEVTIDGQKIKVPGQKIIDAGFRTFQKETAADYRLQMATDLLRKAEEQVRTATPPSAAAPAPEQETEALSDIDLANAIQYGSSDQAAKAVAEMRKRNTVDPAQIAQFVTAQVRNETALQEGVKFVQSEYPDLLANDHVKRMFFVEEGRYRTPKAQGGLGDTRPHKEVYQEIGESLRKSLNMPKPATGTTRSTPTAPSAATAASRQERKAAAPSVPRTAAGRMAANSETPKAKTTTEIIAAMAARRGQGRLTPQSKQE